MTLIKKIFKQVNPALFHRNTMHTDSVTSQNVDSQTNTIEIQYLGTAGFVIKNDDRTVVLDPFVTRPNLWTTLSKPLIPNKLLIQNIISYADDVLIGHAHYDHILDAPDLCHQTGARLIGSTATIMVGRAAGLPEQQLLETQGRTDIQSGKWIVRGLPSIHGKAAFGRIPLPGDMTTPPKWPARFHTLKHGLVLNWLVNTGKLTVVHIDSADFIEQELTGLKADIVCLCAIGRQYRPNYVKDVVRLLQPTWIIPCHWDTMITPINAEPDLLPQVDLEGLLEEIKQAGCEPVLLPILGKTSFKA
jgi:L-ascorbate metabolism protein UlaG (beta-lactamase superfamily)